MNQINQQEEEQIREVMNLLGPGLQQAISNAIVDAELRLRVAHSHADQQVAVEQHSLPPHPDHMPQLIWSCVYAEYIGSHSSSRVLAEDANMLHANAAFHAEMAFNAFNRMFKGTFKHE